MPLPRGCASYSTYVVSIVLGDASEVSRVVDDAGQDKQWDAASKRGGRPVVDLDRYVASHDVADFGIRVAVAPGVAYERHKKNARTDEAHYGPPSKLPGAAMIISSDRATALPRSEYRCIAREKRKSVAVG